MPVGKSNPVFEAKIAEREQAARDKELAKKACFITQHLPEQNVAYDSNSREFDERRQYTEANDAELRIETKYVTDRSFKGHVEITYDGDTVFECYGSRGTDGYTPTAVISIDDLMGYNPGEWEESVDELYADAKESDFQLRRKLDHAQALEDLRRSKQSGIDSGQDK